MDSKRKTRCPVSNCTSGDVLKLSEPADSKTETGFENCPRFEGLIGQKKINRTYDQDCINNYVYCKNHIYAFGLDLMYLYVVYLNDSLPTTAQCFCYLILCLVLPVSIFNIYLH